VQRAAVADQGEELAAVAVLDIAQPNAAPPAVVVRLESGLVSAGAGAAHSFKHGGKGTHAVASHAHHERAS